MKILKRRQTAPQPPSFLDQCERVRTPQGRTAHLRHPVAGVLCGWPAEWHLADESLPTCLLCSDEAERLSAGEVA
jgi:hypothetical protein